MEIIIKPYMNPLIFVWFNGVSPEGVQPPIWCIFLGFNGISGFGFPVNEGFTSNTSVFCCVWPLAWGTWWLTSLTWWFFSGNLNLGGGKVQKSYHQQNEVDKWGKSDKTSVFPWDQFRVYCLVSDIWPSRAWKASHMLVDSSVDTAYSYWCLAGNEGWSIITNNHPIPPFPRSSIPFHSIPYV